MDFQHSRLIDLINYVEATERDKLKTVLDVAQHKGFNYAEADLVDLPDVVLNRTLSDDVIWLEVARLSKRPPPAPVDVELRCWIILSDNTETAPKIRSEMTGRMLADAGLIDAADAPEIKPNHPDADPARGLLRKSMIEELLRTKPTTEAEFRVRIRQDLREATDGEQFQKYMPKVFDILDMLA